MRRTVFSIAVFVLLFVVRADVSLGGQRGPAVQLLSADSGYFTLDASRKVGIYSDGGVRLKVVNRDGRLRTLPLATGCRLAGGPHGGEALLTCGENDLPTVIDLATGATQEVANPNSPPPGRETPNRASGARDTFYALGRHWLGGSRFCGSHVKSLADIDCPVFLNRVTGERRSYSDPTLRDLDDPGLRSAPYRRPRAPSCRSLGRGATFVRARRNLLVLVRCGSRPSTILTRAGYFTFSLEEGIATWAAGDSIFAVNALTDRRVRFRFPGQERASNPISVIVFGSFIYFTVIDPPGTDGRQTFNFSTYRAPRPR